MGLSGFSYVVYGCVLFSKIELFLVWVCLSTFLCFIISFVDFIIVFKRINYPVLSWVNPVWVPFFFLFMLLFYDLWCLIICVG